MKLWVDDLRPAPEGWAAVTNSLDALDVLDALYADGRRLGALSLDHDLGGDDTTRPVMLWMCENDWWPTELYLHTANPVGRDYLEGMARRYAPEGTLRP
ncbi:cyclic-phosphate processing receiver domain-containing protein [Nocardia brasiliensis]|uniref:cyclic-phosphate processing receiver domain-containing protein n=1 Tax=Nocardia brasiliensis TaxID=37326 RepID=UPI0032AECB54